MRIFKILILDDDELRREALLELFHHASFTLEFISDKDFFLKKTDSLGQYNCIACDISLDKWIDDGGTENMFNTVVSAIGKQIPLVIFSSKFNDIITWTNKLIEKRYNLIYTIALNEITEDKEVGLRLKNDSESQQIISNNIFTLLCSSHKMSILNKSKNDEINILHLSDLQFGDPEFDNSLSESFVGSLRRSIVDKEIATIDFIAITGDVSYSGSPKQYEQAYKWIDNLCLNIIGDNYSDRLLLVPGNHDMNLSLCALNNFEYCFPINNKKDGDIKYKKRRKKSDEYTLFSLIPFRNLAYKLTNDSSWLDNQSLTFFNNKFSYLGFRFIHLNSLDPHEQLGCSTAKFLLKNETIDDIRLDIRETKAVDNLLTIVLTHASPNQLGFSLDEEHKNNWTTIANLLIDMNASLYIFGHRHKNLNDMDIALSSRKKMKICGTGTLLCRPDVGDSRGFKVISLKRCESKVTEHKIFKYNYTNGGTIKADI
jgi:3',5'-cyclic AMP phosphodiesterase CpdA/CheY-like chemotaxis protein